MENKIVIKSKKGPVSDSLKRLLNYRIEQEEYSSRIYLAMSMWLTDNGYLGAGKLWKKYSDEEMEHAEKAREILLQFGCQPETPALTKPPQTFTGLPDIIRKSYDHEMEVTTQCAELTKAAMSEGNYMVMELGLWYSKEQAEELGKLQDYIDRLNAFGEDKMAMRFLDNEMNNY
jgi:ferritin